MLLVGIASAACGGSEGGEVGAGPAAGDSDAGAGAGGLAGGAVNDTADDGGSTTTESTEAPPPTETSTTTAPAPVTTQRTTPPQTSPPQTTTQTFQTTIPKPNPNVIGADSLGSEQRQVYDAVGGGKALEAGLTSSAQNHSGKMAASNSTAASTNLNAETGFPWASVIEVTALGSDLASVVNNLAGQAGGWGAYTHIGVGVSTGTNGVYVSVRLGRV